MSGVDTLSAAAPFLILHLFQNLHSPARTSRWRVFHVDCKRPACHSVEDKVLGGERFFFFFFKPGSLVLEQLLAP